MKVPVLSIDAPRHVVRVRNREVELAPMEFKILLALKSADGHVLSREQLVAQAWGPDEADVRYGRTVDQHISRLRRKLKVPVIKTVERFGYQFRETK